MKYASKETNCCMFHNVTLSIMLFSIAMSIEQNVLFHFKCMQTAFVFSTKHVCHIEKYANIYFRLCS